MNRSALSNARDTSPPLLNKGGIDWNKDDVSVGRGKYYLTLESDFSGAWKSTKEALRVANVSVRKADKGRGILLLTSSRRVMANPRVGWD